MMFSNLRRGEGGWIVDGVDGGVWKLAHTGLATSEACGLYRLGGIEVYAQLYLYDGPLNQNTLVKELIKRNMWINKSDG